MSETEAKHNDDKLQQQTAMQHADASEEDDRDAVSSSLSLD